MLAAATRYLVLADLTIADLIGADVQSTFATTPAQLLLARNAMPISLTLAIPLAVFLVSRAGLARSFLISLGGFAAALLLSSAAGNLSTFVLGRILQGFATAVVSSQTFALVQVYAPRSLLNRGVSLIAGVGALGLASGPLLASFVAGSGHWRWVFAALAAAVLLLLPVAWLALRQPLEPNALPIRSARGFFAGSGCCAALALLLTRWPQGTLFDAAWMRGIEVLVAVLLGALLLRRRQHKGGTWDQPTYLVAFLVRLILFGVVATPGFFVVLYLRNQLGWTIEQAALLGVCLSAPMLFGIPLSTQLLRRFSLATLLRAGLLTMAVAMVSWSLALPLALPWLMLLSNGLLGLAIGLLVPAVTASGMRAAAPGHALAASAWLVLADSLGPMLGLAGQGALLLSVTASVWRQGASAAGMPAAQIAQGLDRVQQALPLLSAPGLERAAFVQGLQAVYWSSALVLVLLALVSGRLLWPARASTPMEGVS